MCDDLFRRIEIFYSLSLAIAFIGKDQEIEKVGGS